MSHIPARSTTHGDALAIASGGWMATREERRAAREVNRVRLRGAVATAYDVTRIEAVEEVAGSALVAAAQVSALESALAQQTPQARARLQHIADSSSIAIAGIVTQAGRGI
jgi:hypothetical protein